MTSTMAMALIVCIEKLACLGIPPNVEHYYQVADVSWTAPGLGWWGYGSSEMLLLQI